MSGGARDDTLVVGTDFACFTRVGASTAIRTVIGDVNTEVATLGEAFLATEFTLTLVADFPSSADIVASTAVESIVLVVDTSTVAVGEALLAA